MSDDLVEIARGSHGEVWYADEAMKEPRLLHHVLADEITRLRALCDLQSSTISLSQMRHGRILVGLERRNARQRRALAKLYRRRHDKNAALATARRDGMEGKP